MSAPASDPGIQKLRDVRNLEDLTAYLRDELEWPIADFDIEELTFEYTPKEAGLDPESATKVASIRRLRPLSNDAPWGIFFLDFRPGDLPITVLRRILKAVVIRKREAGRPDRPAWQMHDLLFISALGEDSSRDINLAHFSEDPNTARATLRVVEWDAADTHLHMLRVSGELKRLAWREPGESIDAWRERWASAFELKPGESAKTAKMLAHQMAVLAKFIRQRVNDAIAVESEGGPLRKLYAAFREVLLHDLTTDGFADMYAQTITYGLFAARRSRPMGITIDNAKDMIPSTNPFLRDLLAQFTDASGLTKSLDFDELGVDALIQTLNAANIEAVVADFGRSKPGEDPVIHFYEDFLREYNKAQKIQRGVFYTPQPVVSFIVRSVHELLQTEFQLPDGLASTETWGDMLQKFPDLKIPNGATKDTPFVQVLDPAVGTGTFLVEVIDLIFRTLSEKWKKQGYNPMFDFERLWNEYVPAHLLPRLYGFELMMASYTICHMKVGLKLADYGYKFGAAERLRIYLTNTLEPAHDFSGQFDLWARPIAGEARAANEVKAHTRFTVVVGNPPYSKSSQNQGRWIESLMESYKTTVRTEETQIQALSDDYAKFFRYGHFQLEASGVGILGFISNNGFLDGPLFRDMRGALRTFFGALILTNLHGDSRKRFSPPGGLADESVFDIQQGVAVTVATRSPTAPKMKGARYCDVWGTRGEKYLELARHPARRIINPASPRYLFVPLDLTLELEYEPGWHLYDIFGTGNRAADDHTVYGAGFVTQQDRFAVGFSEGELEANIREFLDPAASETDLWERFSFCSTNQWNFARARRELRTLSVPEAIRRCLYRPFDFRFTILNKHVCTIVRERITSQFLAPGNVGVMSRQVV